jgi:hypothetical protein
MTSAMRDDNDCDSESSGAELGPHQPDYEVRPEEVTVNLSGENAVSKGEGEPLVEALAASSTPRAYQLEMLEESLRHNIIVVVSVVRHEYDVAALDLTCNRWTRAAARRISSAKSFSISLPITDLDDHSSF